MGGLEQERRLVPKGWFLKWKIFSFVWTRRALQNLVVIFGRRRDFL